MASVLTAGNIAICRMAVVALLFSAVIGPAQAQISNLRTPLIPGAPNQDPYNIAPPGPPPPPGHGSVPAPVTPGIGFYEPPVTDVPMPPVAPWDKQTYDGYAAPYLTPPPSTKGNDPGSITPNNAGQQPPVAFVQMNPQGGMPGDFAPHTHWGGQTSQDFGHNLNQASKLNDFGQKLINKPDLYQVPQLSEDGPRGTVPAQDFNSPHRLPQLPGAQGTNDLGQRTLFQGPNLRAKFTIAPY